MTTFINFDSDQPLEMDGDVAAKQFLSILFHHLDQNVMPEDDEYDLIMKIKSILTKGLGQAIEVTRNELEAMPTRFGLKRWRALLAWGWSRFSRYFKILNLTFRGLMRRDTGRTISWIHRAPTVTSR